MMTGHLVTVALGLLVAALLIVMIARSLRRAFARPGPSAGALQAFSLATGRLMLLTAVLGSVLLENWLSALTGSKATLIGILGIAAVLIQLIAETRWPRQSGALRLAVVRPSSLTETVRTRYLVGCALAGVLALGALIFFLTIDPGVTTRDPGDLLASCPATVAVGCVTGSFGTSIVPGFGTAAPVGSSLLVAAAALIVMALLVPVAIRQILRRPSLAGADPALDRILRRVAAGRVLRALTATCLGFIVAMAADLQNALESYSPRPGALPRALDDFLVLINIGCVIGILVLYAVGPNNSTLRQAVKAAAVTPTR